MKKNGLLLVSAAILMAGCTANDDLAPNMTSLETTGSQISFTPLKTAMTRATESGSTAAEKLNKEFVVYATKHQAKAEDGTATNDAIAFQNYTVKWSDNTAGTTSSNSANWEYVGVDPYKSVASSTDGDAHGAVTPVATSQTIKYWDYSADNGYTFTAFSAAKLLKDAQAVVAKTTGVESGDVYDKGYKVTIPSGYSLDDIYFSDRKEVAKADYNKPVVLTFRNLGAKVRVGFYETIPGYSVKIDKFYYGDDGDAAITTYSAMSSSSTEAFKAAIRNVTATPAAESNAAGGTKGTNVLTITYGDGTTATGEAINQPKVSAGSESKYVNTLTLGKGVLDTELGTDAASATWDTSNGAYTTVYPNLENNQPMLIRCDYTLTATDGSKETIKVYNARVIVPTQYVQWKSNYAYTYLFKISDQSNGTTGKDPSDPDNPDKTDSPEGLFPITFDAVVVSTDEYQQETITTVASNSVTSYAKGSDVTKANKYEYKVGEEVYFVDTKTDDKSVITPSGIGEEAGKAQVYKLSGITTPTEADVIAQLTGLNNGLILTATDDKAAATTSTTVPSADGTDITMSSVKFTIGEEGYYAYVYCGTKYVAAVYEAASDWDDSTSESTTYFRKATKDGKDYYYVASGVTKENYNKSELYTLKTKATDGVYDVKVIKAVAKQVLKKDLPI